MKLGYGKIYQKSKILLRHDDQLSNEVTAPIYNETCCSITAKPTYIKKEKDIPRLPEI